MLLMSIPGEADTHKILFQSRGKVMSTTFLYSVILHITFPKLSEKSRNEIITDNELR